MANPHLEILYIANTANSIGEEIFYMLGDKPRIHSIYAFPIIAPKVSIFSDYPEITYDSFNGISSKTIIYVPMGSFESYYLTWQYFSDFREFDPSSVEAIQDDLTGMIKVKTSGHTLSISNKPSNAICRVFNASGILVTETTENEIAIPQSGLYIVEVEGTTQKVII